MNFSKLLPFPLLFSWGLIFLEPNRNVSSVAREVALQNPGSQVTNTFLDDVTCVDRGVGLFRGDQEVAVGNKLYTSIMQVYPGTKITCRLRKTGSRNKFKRLYLIFGLDADSNIKGSQIILYKDDEPIINDTIEDENINKLVLKVEDAHSISLEIACPPETPQCKNQEGLNNAASNNDSDPSQSTVHFFQATFDSRRTPVISQRSRRTPATSQRSRRTPATSQSSRRTSITQQSAVDLINLWLEAKKVIFAPPYNRVLLAELTTSKLYKSIAGANGRIEQLRRSNSYYRYDLQQIESVEQFVADDVQATIKVQITENVKFYQNGYLDPRQSSTNTTTVTYTLQLTRGGTWKIANSKFDEVD